MRSPPMSEQQPPLGLENPSSPPHKSRSVLRLGFTPVPFSSLDMNRSQLIGLSACFILLSTASAGAQDLVFLIDPAVSTANVNADTSTALPGTVIGDFDATSNPTGTRTVPGLFGGGGNNAIPMDLALGTSTAFLGLPTGQFGLDFDSVGLTALVHDLDVDLLGGGSADSALILSMLYDTFRSFSPDSLYFGGFPIDVPLASQTLTDFRLLQVGPGVPAVLVPGANTGEFTFATAITAELSFNVDFQGQVTPVGPIPTLLPLAGTLTVTSAGMSAQLDFAQAMQQQILDPAPGFVITDAPLALPTILPPGETANLLLNATIASIDVDLATSVSLVAHSAPDRGFSTYCVANPNSTGFTGELLASGSADVTAANLTLTASRLPNNVNGLFFMSQSRAEVPIFGSEGILCLGAPQIRFVGNIQNSGNAGAMSFSPDFAQLPQGTVFLPGSTWNFQLWHRDGSPIMTTSNTTNAAEVRFCP